MGQRLVLPLLFLGLLGISLGFLGSVVAGVVASIIE